MQLVILVQQISLYHVVQVCTPIICCESKSKGMLLWILGFCLIANLRMAMTWVRHVNKINLEQIIAELTCKKSCIPRAPSRQFTQSRASRHDGKMSSFSYTAICFKNKASSWTCVCSLCLCSSSLFGLTSEHGADNITSQGICHWASRSALIECWTSVACWERVANHDQCTTNNVKSALKPHCLCVRSWMFLPHLGVRTQHNLLWVPPRRL